MPPAWEFREIASTAILCSLRRRINGGIPAFPAGANGLF